MSNSILRRSFLRVAGGMVSVLMFPFPLRAGRKKEMMTFAPEIEPLVQLLLETPRGEIIDRLGERIRQGATESEVLAALLMAGAYDVQPRPHVGFKFHTVLVAQSLHLIAERLEGMDRWIPYFWASDYFKDAQADDASEGDWKMSPVDESSLPSMKEAEKRFLHAMEHWQEAEADAAVTVLARNAKPEEIWELFFPLGARDYRSIGHKAIDVANTHRVLNVIGWEHAETALRSLAYALLMHEDGNPSERNAWADEPGRKNRQRIEQLPNDWQEGKEDDAAVIELLAVLREGSEEETPKKVVELLERGVAVSSIWEALFLQAGELVVRQPGIVALHSVTTSRALHYAYRQTKNRETQAYLLLQGASFLPMFRKSMEERGNVDDFIIDRIESGTIGSMNEKDAVGEIFQAIPNRPSEASEKTLTYFQSEADPEPWSRKACGFLIEKGRGPHDYKYTSAVLEIQQYLSSRWRPHFMSTTAYLLKGAGDDDQPLVAKVRAALS